MNSRPCWQPALSRQRALIKPMPADSALLMLWLETLQQPRAQNCCQQHHWRAPRLLVAQPQPAPAHRVVLKQVSLCSGQVAAR